VLDGGDGNDRLYSNGTGADTHNSGDGDDIIDLNARTSLLNVVVDGGAGMDTLDLIESFVTLDTVERFVGIERIDTLLTHVFGTSAGDNLDFGAFVTLAFGAPLGITIDGGLGKDCVGGSFVVAANDTLLGGGGSDVIRGYGGADRIDGGLWRDILIGGQGADVFVFTEALSSTVTSSDSLRAGNGATSFEGAGAAAGDLIDVSALDANRVIAGNQAFVFGGVGIGQLQVINDGTNSIVLANVDADADFEFRLVIEDGGVLASAYSAADFML